MLSIFVTRIVDLIDKHYPLKDQRSICIYALDLLLYTILSTVGLVLVGLLLNKPLDACVIIIVFYLNQSSGGGFHANTHLTCFLTMTVGLVGALFLVYLDFSVISYWIIGLVSCGALFLVPLVLHPNKSYLAKHSVRFIYRSRIITIFEVLVLFIFMRFSFCTAAFSAGALVSAISRLFAWQQRRKRSKRCKSVM